MCVPCRVKDYHILESQMSLELRRAVTYASQVGWLTQLWYVPSDVAGGVRVEQTSSVVVCVQARGGSRQRRWR